MRTMSERCFQGHTRHPANQLFVQLMLISDRTARKAAGRKEKVQHQGGKGWLERVCGTVNSPGPPFKSCCPENVCVCACVCAEWCHRVCSQHYTKDADGLCTRLIKPKVMEGTVAAQDEFSRSKHTLAPPSLASVGHGGSRRRVWRPVCLQGGAATC